MSKLHNMLVSSNNIIETKELGPLFLTIIVNTFYFKIMNNINISFNKIEKN